MASWRRIGMAGLLASLLAWVGVSCYDPLPGAIHLTTTVNGEPHGCMAQVYTDKGIQIQSWGVNDGHVDVDNLVPGTYTLKFKGYDDQLYPATRTVKLYSAGEVTLTIELTKADDPTAPPSTPASTPPS